MIVTRGLTKRYRRSLAVDDVGLDVREGDRYGFLGPNGSGKTTTVRMLLGLVLPTKGEIEVLGQRMPRHAGKVLPHVGALVEGPAAYGHLSARANLALLDASGKRSMRHTRAGRIDAALERVGLDAVGRKPVRAYSLGMRQRLGLAAALLEPRRLLVLDEPTNGLDPRGMTEIRDLLLEVNRAGTTVFLSSHLLGEVDTLCTRVGILDAGRLVVQEDLASLRKPTGRVIVTTEDADEVHAMLNGRVEDRAGERLFVRADDASELNALLVGKGIRIRAIAGEEQTLEDVVLASTGHGSDRVTQP
jgi:ABC-2 type transport system ATP-binding protein